MAAINSVRAGEHTAVVTRRGKTSVVETHAVDGRIVRISDPEIQPGVNAFKRRVAKTPASARKWLKELGYLTPSGNVSKRYGGR